MPEFVNRILEQFKALPPGRQVALVATTAGSLAFFLWLMGGTTSGEYRMLFGGLEESEIASVTEGLQQERIDYRLERGGTAIYVPAALVHEARIRLAGRGLPTAANPGFELFDRGDFGVTDFVQKVNFSRAVAGELSRSIERLEPVDKARVQLAQPKRSAFLRKEDKSPSASVVVSLRPGWDLSAEQVRSIVHLVASSVAELNTSRVTVIDNHGRLLAPNGSGPAGPRAAGGAFGQQARVERELEERIESILQRTVGLGRVSAKVSAELDWTEIETTEERFDPDSQIARSEQRTSETGTDSSGREGGVPGVRANTPDEPIETAVNTRNSNSSRSSETINYELNKLISHKVMASGTIKRLSVAVLVDGQPGEGGEVSEFTPWDAERLKDFEEIAKRAVGFSRERGDEISLINVPFAGLVVADDGSWFDPQVIAIISTLLHWVGVLVALLLFARLLIRPLASAIQFSPPPVGPTVGALDAQLNSQQALEAGIKIGPDGVPIVPGIGDEPRQMSLQEQVDTLAQARGEDSVKTIRGWLGST